MPRPGAGVKAKPFGRQAAGCARTARRLRALPVTTGAYRDGVLSAGQVQAIAANLKDRTVGLFAAHEAELVPELAQLSAGDTAIAMQDWARRADAVVGDDPDKPQPERSLHLSRILDGAANCPAASTPKAAPSSPPPSASPPPATSTANPPAAPPNDAATPWSTSAAGFSITNRPAAAAATGPTSTSSPPSTTSNGAARAG